MAYEEYRHPFVGPTGHAAVCHVPIYRPADHVVVVLWDELEQLHAQLGLPAPTATLTIEVLKAEVERLREQVAADERHAR